MDDLSLNVGTLMMFGEDCYVTTSSLVSMFFVLLVSTSTLEHRLTGTPRHHYQQHHPHLILYSFCVRYE